MQRVPVDGPISIKGRPMGGTKVFMLTGVFRAEMFFSGKTDGRQTSARCLSYRCPKSTGAILEPGRRCLL